MKPLLDHERATLRDALRAAGFERVSLEMIETLERQPAPTHIKIDQTKLTREFFYALPCEYAGFRSFIPQSNEQRERAGPFDGFILLPPREVPATGEDLHESNYACMSIAVCSYDVEKKEHVWRRFSGTSDVFNLHSAFHEGFAPKTLRADSLPETGLIHFWLDAPFFVEAWGSYITLHRTR